MDRKEQRVDYFCSKMVRKSKNGRAKKLWLAYSFLLLQLLLQDLRRYAMCTFRRNVSALHKKVQTRTTQLSSAACSRPRPTSVAALSLSDSGNKRQRVFGRRNLAVHLQVSCHLRKSGARYVLLSLFILLLEISPALLAK